MSDERVAGRGPRVAGESAERFRRHAESLKASPAQLSALYQDVILDHYRRPRNKGSLPEGAPRAKMKNPLCGDEIEVAISFGDDGRVTEARFDGQGCSISQASASIMTELAVGKSSAELASVSARVKEMLAGSHEAAADAALGELRALSGVAKYPARHKCAIIAWEALNRLAEK